MFIQDWLLDITLKDAPVWSAREQRAVRHHLKYLIITLLGLGKYLNLAELVTQSLSVVVMN